VFLIALSLVAILITSGVSAGTLSLLGFSVAMAFTLRYTQIAFYAGVILTPCLGILLSLPTGRWLFGLRAFGGSIDVSLGEVILFFVLAAWSIKLVALWRIRRETHRLPLWPVAEAYLFLFFAHLASSFSPLKPDAALVTKFAFRPVLFNYLAFILLPVNLIRSRRRLMAVLVLLAGVGTLAALNGLISIFFPVDASHLLGRAHPLPIFGTHALGDNQNELADLLIFTAPATYALVYLMRSDVRRNRLLIVASLFQVAICLLTFTRTAWIVLLLQMLLLLSTDWRESIKRYAREVALIGLVLLPLSAVMLSLSLSSTAQSSLSTRLMLSQIAAQVFSSSPWLGGGAGTFVERVGSTRVFILEYGDPLDSHGWIQKLAAETGLLGLIALLGLYTQLVWVYLKGWRAITGYAERKVYLLLLAGAAGALIYQLFNTDYWTGKMWLPVGLALAGMHVLATRDSGDDSTNEGLRS